MDRYATGQYAEAVPDWHSDDAPHKAAAVVALLSELGWEPKRVADVGCGTGSVLARVCEALDCEGQGVDVAPAAIERAASRPGLQFAVGDVSAVAPCDVVLCLDVVEHVADDIELVRSLADCAPRIVLRIPLDASALDVLRPGRMLAARRNWGHRHVYTIDLVRALIDDAGLDLVALRFDRVPFRASTAKGRLSDAVRRICHRWAPEPSTRVFGGYSVLLAATPRGSSCV